MWGEASLKKRAGTARSTVTEFSGSGVLNPTPAADPEPSDLMMNQLLPEKLVGSQC